MDSVVVFRTFNLAEAQLIRSRLEGAGFQASVEHEHSATNLDVAVGGARVTVPSEQGADAQALLQDFKNEP